MYVLDKDGNLVSADVVADILQQGYSDLQDELFIKYDVISRDPRPVVSLLLYPNTTTWLYTVLFQGYLTER